MADLGEIVGLPVTLTQNYVDFVAKQLQTMYDAYFGSDKDNDSEPLPTPYILQTKTVFAFEFDKVPSAHAPSRGYFYNVLIGDVNINSYSDTTTYLSNFLYATDLSFGNFDSDKSDNLAYYKPLIQGLGEPFTVNKSSNFVTDFTLDVDRYLANTSVYPSRKDLFSIDTWFVHSGNISRIYVNSNNYEYRYKDVNCSYVSSPAVYLQTYDNFPVITTVRGDNNVYNNIVNDTDIQVYNYTTNQGDNINVYYSDNKICIPSAPYYDRTTGFNAGLSLTYNDFEDMFNFTLGGLGLGLDFPSYNEIKYGDRGNFYIPPIEQYPLLPSAPELTYDLELADTPQLVGGAITSYLDIMDAMGVSSLLIGCIIVVFIINKLRGH